MLVYALDIGGSSVKHGLVEVTAKKASVIEPFPTIILPSVDFTNLEAVILRALEITLARERSVRRIGISTTGSVDASGIVVSAGHFKGYQNISWSHFIKTRFEQIEHVAIVNDGRASAWAEFSADPAGTRSHIHVVVGTGVGVETKGHLHRLFQRRGL